MKKIIMILFFLIITTPAYAIIYKWVDQKGAMNFTDDIDKVPPGYRDSAEQINTPRKQAPSSTQLTINTPTGWDKAMAPSIEQGLIREGFFAVELAQALQMGPVKGEAEAESMLASAGIAPRNGWIADYPLTPDIVGELQGAIGAAADSGRLTVKKDEALKAYQGLINQQGLPVIADSDRQDAEVEPPQDYGDYSNPEVINNYYYDQGPPIVSYYAPPPDFNYLYSWVPYPFWYSGFRFRGFFVLCDFHRVVFAHGKWGKITNHVTDSHTKRVSRIDAATRRFETHPHPVTGEIHTGGYASREARRGASSILTHNQERAKSENLTAPRAETGASGRQVNPQRRSNPSIYRSPVPSVRPASTRPGMSRNPIGVGSRNPSGSSFGHPRSSSGSGSGRTLARSFAPSTSGSSFRGLPGGGGLGSANFSRGSARGHR